MADKNMSNAAKVGNIDLGDYISIIDKSSGMLKLIKKSDFFASPPFDTTNPITPLMFGYGGSFRMFSSVDQNMVKNAETPVSWDTTDYIDGGVSVAGSEITIAAGYSGLWEFDCMLGFKANASATTSDRFMIVYKNGVVWRYLNRGEISLPGTSKANVQRQWSIQLNAGEKLEIRGGQTTTLDMDIAGGDSGDSCYIAGHFVRPIA